MENASTPTIQFFCAFFCYLCNYCIFPIAEARTLRMLKYLAYKTCLGLFSRPGTLPDCRAVFQKSRKFRVRVEELCLQGSGGEGQGDVETILDNQFPVCVCVCVWVGGGTEERGEDFSMGWLHTWK